MEKKFLDKTGLSRFFNNIKNAFAPISHNHTKAQITDFPDIPTKTSQIENDSGFLTRTSLTIDYIAAVDEVKTYLNIQEATIPNAEDGKF